MTSREPDHASASTPAFWFLIPLRGKAAARDWERVCSHLRDTLGSVLNQTDPAFKIMLVCDDVPDLGTWADDPRVIVTSQRFPVPTDLAGQMHDKQAKKRLGGALIGAEGGGYVMLVDSDDFVSRHIVEYVRTAGAVRGYYIEQGFEYFRDTGLLRPLDQFNRLCGTSYILRLDPADLPPSLDAPARFAFDQFSNHRLVVETATNLGWALRALPFPGAVYLRENGENHSVRVRMSGRPVSRYRVRRWLEQAKRRLKWRNTPLDPTLVEEFRLPT